MFETFFKYPYEQFRQGVLHFAGGVRPELVVLAMAVAVAAAVFFYRRSARQVTRGRRWLLAGLRGVALALLVLILLHPVLQLPRPQTLNTFVAVLVDDSASMSIEDAGKGGAAEAAKADRKSRLNAAKDLLGTAEQKHGLLNQLSDICPVRPYRFSDQPERIAGLDQLTGRGERTNLYDALNVVDSQLRGVPVAAVVLLSDGAANAGGLPQDAARRLKALGTPVYCVGIGDPNPPKDYEVVRVQAPREVRRNTSVEIFATVRTHGYQEPFKVLLRKGSELLQEVAVTPAEGTELFRVALGFQPDDQGTFRYTVEIPPAPDEVITRNNSYDFLVQVVDKRLPVLYLEGSPREEYRFLRRALFRDKDFRIVSILRLDGPKKFLLQGAEPEDGLDKGFPTDLTHLARFEAIILGDIEASYLTTEQLGLIEKLVSQKGRGFLMLGGVNSFNLGGYQGTPLEKLLPVTLPPAGVNYEQREFNIALTKAGETHPIMRQSGNLLVNRNIWSKAPTLLGYNPISDVKPAAEVLARDPRTDMPVLAVQPYGAGRTAAFTTGGSWHWRMAEPTDNPLHERFWRQMIRWLAVGAKSQITLELNKDLFARGERVSLRATVLDAKLEPVNDAQVVAKIIDPATKPRELKMDWILSVEGVYQAEYEPSEPGDYQVEVTATDKDGVKAVATATFSVGETMDEFSDPGQKTGVLKEIASITGGEYVSPDKPERIAEQVRRRVLEMKRDETVYDSHDLWDTPLLLCLLAAALSAEWLLRRRAGLM